MSPGMHIIRDIRWRCQKRVESIHSILQSKMVYIATFYSHFGAIRFKKICEEKQVKAKIMPVPRNLSSSCGTCVRYEAEEPCPPGSWPEEVEQAVLVEADGYLILYRAENS